jgi:hypothetical protein
MVAAVTIWTGRGRGGVGITRYGFSHLVTRWRYQGRVWSVRQLALSIAEGSNLAIGQVLKGDTKPRWQAHNMLFRVFAGGKMIFERSFTSNGVENILREDADA